MGGWAATKSLNKQTSHRSAVWFLVGITLLTATSFAALSTWRLWNSRSHQETRIANVNYWKILASSSEKDRVHLRFEDSAYWLPARSHLLSKRTHVATQKTGTRIYQLQSGSEIQLAADSVLHIDPAKDANSPASVSLLSGMALFKGPLIVKSRQQTYSIDRNESKTFFVDSDDVTIDSRPIETLKIVGQRFNIDLSKTPTIEIQIPRISSEDELIEFSRTSNFSSIVFSKKIASNQLTVPVDLGERAPGAWFARQRSRESGQLVTRAVINFQTFKVLSPEKVVRYGQRWISWADFGPSSYYRVETSGTQGFVNINSSFYTRDRLFDLSQIDHVGQIFVRVVGISPTEEEHIGPHQALLLPPKAEMLKSSSEIGNPALRLFARGWRIQLNDSEARRVREGYVILRESELRGIRVATEIESEVQSKPLNYIFEISKDQAFSNPERVRPTSRGELLPPALPLGLIFTRLREVDDDGQLGAFGPASRISTLLPAPLPLPTRQTRDDVQLSWSIPVDVAGFEVKYSESPKFSPESTKTIRTALRSKSIAKPASGNLHWNVTAIQESGGAVSQTSNTMVVRIERKQPIRRLAELRQRPPTSTEIRRSIAALNPSLIELIEPLEDAVIVGAATSSKYGQLRWRNLDPLTPNGKSPFVVEISTDRDFVHIVERGSTNGTSYKLEGDLPEGSLFWRVRKKGAGEWSSTRRLELVFE